MFNYVNKLRKTRSTTRLGRGGRTSRKADPALDERLSFKPFPDESWTFQGERHVLLNDEDVGEMVTEERDDVRVLSGLSQGLSEYQNFVWSRGGKGFGKFNATVTSLQDKILGRLGGLYDGLTGRVSVEYSGEDFWINNINVKSVLKLYWQRPTEKARRYLMGLRDKLDLILSRQQSSTKNDAIALQSKQLLEEITRALEYLPADAPPRLESHSRSA